MTRETTTIEFKVLSTYAYFLTYGEDDELSNRELAALNTFTGSLEAQHCPEGYRFGHYSVEPENWSEDFGTCEATGHRGELCQLTAVYFKAEEVEA